MVAAVISMILVMVANGSDGEGSDIVMKILTKKTLGKTPKH